MPGSSYAYKKGLPQSFKGYDSNSYSLFSCGITVWNEPLFPQVEKYPSIKGLLEHYKTTCIEQHTVPEFISRDGSEPMTGELGELTCLENQVAMLMCFHRLGYKNIIASDIDDLRTSDIPVVFKGTDFITQNLYAVIWSKYSDKL